MADLGSEVHRFVWAGIKSVKDNAARSIIRGCRKNWLESSGKKRPVKSRAAKSRVKRKRKMEMVRDLLLKMRVLRKNLPAQHDSSYDSNYLKVLDKGGLSYVSPTFLKWAKHTMKLIRAKVNVAAI